MIKIEDSIEKRLQWEKDFLPRSLKSGYRHYSNKMGCKDTEKRSGHVYIMCPHCYTITLIEIDISYIITSTNEENVTLYLQYRKFCKVCKRWVEGIEIDYNLGKVISMLNTKGYHTLYCCEGHGKTTPYIYFKRHMILPWLNTIPSEFSYEFAPEGIIIRANNQRVWKEAMYEITLWAEALPEV